MTCHQVAGEGCHTWGLVSPLVREVHDPFHFCTWLASQVTGEVLSDPGTFQIFRGVIVSEIP